MNCPSPRRFSEALPGARAETIGLKKELAEEVIVPGVSKFEEKNKTTGEQGWDTTVNHQIASLSSCLERRQHGARYLGPQKKNCPPISNFIVISHPYV